MFGAELRYLYASVTEVYGLLVHTMDLIAEDDGISLLLAVGDKGGVYGVKHGRALTLLHGKDLVALVMQLIHGVRHRGEMSPADALLRAEGGLVYLVLRRSGSYAAEEKPLGTECVAGAEDAPDIVH